VWATHKGRSRLVGPAQWSVNEEVGLLVDGFENPNVLLMSYGRPYYAPAVEAAGFTKIVDMLAFQADLHEGYPRPKMTQMMVDYAKRSDAITWRTLDKTDFNGEIKRAMDIFNDAWSENWGFLPFPDEAIQHLAKEMKPLIAPERFLMGSIDGELAAFLCLLPDLNELSRGFDGKLLPFNWAKLIYRPVSRSWGCVRNITILEKASPSLQHCVRNRLRQRAKQALPIVNCLGYLRTMRV